MKTYIVSYDLIGISEGSADYHQLIERIKSYPWAKLQYSTWLVRSSATATQIRDSLRTVMDGDDRLFVARLSGEGAWRNAICSNEWLHTNL